MWLYLVALVALWTLLRLFRERRVVSHLHDKYVFIMGCDTGFGNLLARQLDRRGMRVLAACLTENGAEELRKKASERLETVILDVTKTESIVAATEWVKERVGNRGLWGLVNNAGISIPTGPNEWLKKEDFAKILDVNLLGMIEVTLNMLPLVRKARGRVVNMSSVAGRVSFFGGGYCISKHGVEAFSDSLRRELSHFGVKVAIIEPGFFKTGACNSDMHVSSVKTVWDQVSTEVKEMYGEKFLASYLTKLKSLDQNCSEDLSLVTDCMEHALTSCYPRTRYSGLWGLVNNAVIASFAPNEWLKKEDFAKVLDVNLLGMIEVTLNMLPLVRKARGRVVNMSSVAGRVSFFGGGYCISKYGVEAFSDSLRRELSYFGVKVAIIEPGGFKTMSNSDRLLSHIKLLWDQASSEVKEIYGEKFLSSYLETFRSSLEKSSEDLTLVTDCMEHALTSCYPRTRYSAGRDAKLFYLPMSYLPTCIVDAFFYWTSQKPDQAL